MVIRFPSGFQSKDVDSFGVMALLWLFNSKIQLFPIPTKLARLVSLYAGVWNLQYECCSCRDGRVISKNQNKMAVAYYNMDVTRHEKIGLMCIKYIPSHYYAYLNLSIRYTCDVNCIKFPIVCFTSNKSFTNKLCLNTKLWNFKVQKMVKFYVHIYKPYFLLPGHIWWLL